MNDCEYTRKGRPKDSAGVLNSRLPGLDDLHDRKDHRNTDTIYQREDDGKGNEPEHLGPLYLNELKETFYSTKLKTICETFQPFF